MARAPKSSTPLVSATDQAAAWFARQRTGPWPESDAAEFAAWLKAHPSHTAAWASYQRLWGQLETVRDDPKILAIREQARRRASRGQVWRLIRRFGVGLAASVLLAGTAWWSIRIAQTELAGTGHLTGVRDASTEIGERSLVMLADGSKVTLNTASAVHADYSGRERRVTLVRGEAFFDVAKDPNRPFVVSAGSHQVIAVGTAFDVRLQDSAVKVTLVEGKVRVLRFLDPTATPTAQVKPVSAVTLEAGSTLVGRDDGADQLERLDPARATSWRTGNLVFDGERLADVVAEMNRYSRQKFVIGNPALAERRISGVFEPTGGSGFAEALEAYGIAHATEKNATTIVLDSPR
jgi:transmembrane sensor